MHFKAFSGWIWGFWGERVFFTLKERAGIPGPKEFGPVAIHELMYTFLDTFLLIYNFKKL